MIYHILKQTSDRSEELLSGSMCLSLSMVDGVLRTYLDQLTKFYRDKVSEMNPSLYTDSEKSLCSTTSIVLHSHFTSLKYWIELLIFVLC